MRWSLQPAISAILSAEKVSVGIARWRRLESVVPFFDPLSGHQMFLRDLGDLYRAS